MKASFTYVLLISIGLLVGYTFSLSGEDKQKSNDDGASGRFRIYTQHQTEESDPTVMLDTQTGTTWALTVVDADGKSRTSQMVKVWGWVDIQKYAREKQ